jgi:hypothetical protein
VDWLRKLDRGRTGLEKKKASPDTVSSTYFMTKILSKPQLCQLLSCDKAFRFHFMTGGRQVSEHAGDVERERKSRHVLRMFWLPFVKIMGALINNVVST